MTLNQLRTFLAVAEHESVHGAAQELVVTQAAVSASLAALQKALGLALVAPDGRGLRLTDAGRAYAGYVRRIIGLLDEAGLAAAACADPERGELRIAAVTTAAEQVVPGILGGFRRDHPLTGVRLEAGNRDQVRSLLDRHLVDLVVTGRPEPGSGTRASTAALLAELDIAPLALMVGSNGAIRESARVGLGVTLVSRDAVAAELAAGRLAEIGVPGTPLHRDWYLLARREELPPPASRLVDHVLHTGAFRAPDQEEPR